MRCLVKVLSGWVDRTGLSDTVVVAGSYEVTPPWQGCGWGRQVITRTASEDASAGYWVRPHPDRLCGPWEVFERLAGDVAFQAAHDLAGRQALGPSPPHVVAGLGIG